MSCISVQQGHDLCHWSHSKSSLAEHLSDQLQLRGQDRHTSRQQIGSVLRFAGHRGAFVVRIRLPAGEMMRARRDETRRK